jgi:hypothetical protein
VQSLVRHDIIEQFSVLAELHDEKQFAFGLDDFVQLDDIRMADFLKNFDLSADTLDVFFVLDARFFKDFNGHLQTVSLKLMLTFSLVSW